MFDGILNFFRKLTKSNAKENANSKDTAKERLHLVLMQDRANVSADFLELMKQEIIDVIKKYIEVDESAIDVRLTNKTTQEGENGAPALYANIPILNIRNDMKKINIKEEKIEIEEKAEESEKADEPVEVAKEETEQDDKQKEDVEDNNEEISKEEPNENEEIKEEKEIENKQVDAESVEENKENAEV